jgi:hypothetical protein
MLPDLRGNENSFPYPAFSLADLRSALLRQWPQAGIYAVTLALVLITFSLRWVLDPP